MKSLFKLLRRILLLGIVALIAYVLGGGHFWTAKVRKYEFVEAIPPSGLSLSREGTCVEPTEQERALVAAAVDVLAFPTEASGSLGIGAEKLLSHPLHRKEGRTSQRVCDIPELLERAAHIIENSDHLRKGRIVEYGLNLIARLPHVSDDLAKVVAESAFNDTPQQSGLLSDRDIRPLARATLAGLGLQAKPYAEQAFRQISMDDAMGTGAAQIAVAGRHPGALRAVERLMAEKLATLPRDRAVPWNVRNRLYEMAYALASGGEQARQHMTALRDLMSRKVQSWAPPFGMIEVPPRRMCRVAAKIMKVGVADLELQYCADKDAAYEQ